jgi:O-acetyl-ADP-ribose deacetylase (regulator of RNase III)
MSELCPAYLSSGDCLVKVISNPRLTSFLTKIQLDLVVDSWGKDCQGQVNLCTFKHSKEQSIPEPVQTPEPEPEPIVDTKTKISIHKLDDPLLNRMSRGIIQSELDRFQKPINMGTVYITSNGGENSKVKAQKIYHATVAGESRLVNEVDLKSAMRKALLLADEEGARNVVVIPADCGTHDINDTARVQLAAIKTYLSTAKDSNIKNIFLVMEDEESYQVYEEYYNRIFL